MEVEECADVSLRLLVPKAHYPAYRAVIPNFQRASILPIQLRGIFLWWEGFEVALRLDERGRKGVGY